MIPLVSELAALRKGAGLRQQEIAVGLGLGSRAGITMVSAWEHGHSIPTVGHACGYAGLVGYHVVVTRDGQIVGDLPDVMPRLRELIDKAGSSMSGIAAGLFMDPASVRSIVRLAGPRTRLTSAQSLLGAVRCTLALALTGQDQAGGVA